MKNTKKYKNKILFQKPSKRAILHTEGIQLERLEGLVLSVRELLQAAHIDFEMDVMDTGNIRELLLDTFDEEVSVLLLNDDVAAAWAVGFAQASIIARKLMNEEYEDESP